MTSALRSKVITARKDPFVLLVHPSCPSEESSQVQLEELNFPIAHSTPALPPQWWDTAKTSNMDNVSEQKKTKKSLLTV